MVLSEEATQMVRGEFKPGTLRSPVHNLAIVATPQQLAGRGYALMFITFNDQLM